MIATFTNKTKAELFIENKRKIILTGDQEIFQNIIHTYF
jgi:hypothetical protein